MQPTFSHNYNELLSYTKLVMLCGGRGFDVTACFVGGRTCNSAEWRLTIGQYKHVRDHAVSTCRKLKRDESTCAIHAHTSGQKSCRRIAYMLCIKPWNHREIRNFNGNEAATPHGNSRPAVSLSLKLIRILAFVLYTRGAMESIQLVCSLPWKRSKISAKPSTDTEGIFANRYFNTKN
jgi:hypothetical protein